MAAEKEEETAVLVLAVVSGESMERKHPNLKGLSLHFALSLSSLIPQTDAENNEN